MNNMPSDNFIEALLHPLLFRATTSQSANRNTFKDMAAELLVEKLELKDYIGYKDKPLAERTNDLSRCLWIDQTVLSFFKQYPDGVGVNLNSGLNTRFHRISQQLEWPRFRWADIDTVDTIAFNQGLLPSLDNYRAIGCDINQDNWLAKTGWKPGTPLIIVIDTPCDIDSDPMNAVDSAEKMTGILRYLQKTLNNNTLENIHIVVDISHHTEGLFAQIVNKVIALTGRHKQRQNRLVNPAALQKIIMGYGHILEVKTPEHKGRYRLSTLITSALFATKQWTGLYIRLSGKEVT